MGLSEEHIQGTKEIKSSEITIAKKRRLRRKKLRAAKAVTHDTNVNNIDCPKIATEKVILNTFENTVQIPNNLKLDFGQQPSKVRVTVKNKSLNHISSRVTGKVEMSSKGETDKPRDEVLAAREAKKMAKLAKKKATGDSKDVPQQTSAKSQTSSTKKLESKVTNIQDHLNPEASISEKGGALEKTPISIANKAKNTIKGRDEVDRAAKVESLETTAEISKDLIKNERAAKKAAKQAKKKGEVESSDAPNIQHVESTTKPKNDDKTKIGNLEASQVARATSSKLDTLTKNRDKPVSDLTVKEMVDTLKDIVSVARDVQAVTNKVKAIQLGSKQDEVSTKSKADLKAERRAKQEAQRAAKEAAQQQKATEVKSLQNKKTAELKQEKSKPKAVDKVKPKSQVMQKMNWFQHLYTEHDKEALKQMEMNSNLHPAVIKLGIQLASHVVTGSNARCIALLDALKKMVRDYSLPARTEFARGLESQLAASVDFLWSMRPPAASQTNALKYFRHHLTQLPNNVDEFDAKKRLQEEIDRYIREQIDMAGEAISIAVRDKISDGDNILTYGCSSLIERILCEAHAAGVRFRAVVVGTRVQRGARETLRRLVARGVPCTYADISALSFLMRDMSKVLIGAAALLANGAVLAPVGSLPAALVARAHNVPLLVACETHKFSDAVQTDAFVYNEIGDPDDIIDKSDENSPLKDWRSNPNLTLLNLTYDVTPPSLVTAVVTELAILPCTSAPVVLRFKLSEYGL